MNRTDLLRLQLMEARQAAREIRHRLSVDTRHERRIMTAYRDALLLAELHVGYQSTARDAMIAARITTKRRWDNAIALLRLARVYDGRRFTVHDLASVEAALNRAARVALESPDSYRARLVAHAK